MTDFTTCLLLLRLQKRLFERLIVNKQNKIQDRASP